MKIIKKTFEKLKKKKNKTFLNSLNILIAALIVLFTLILTFLSNQESSCNNDVQIMLINKTQLYVEAQTILIERTQDFSNRVACIVLGDKEGEEAHTERISAAHSEYISFIKFMEDYYDPNVKVKQSECTTLNNGMNIITFLIVSLAVIHLYISARFFSRYLNDK